MFFVWNTNGCGCNSGCNGCWNNTAYTQTNTGNSCGFGSCGSATSSTATSTSTSNSAYSGCGCRRSCCNFASANTSVNATETTQNAYSGCGCARNFGCNCCCRQNRCCGLDAFLWNLFYGGNNYCLTRNSCAQNVSRCGCSYN